MRNGGLACLPCLYVGHVEWKIRRVGVENIFDMCLVLALRIMIHLAEQSIHPSIHIFAVGWSLCIHMSAVTVVESFIAKYMVDCV